MAQLVGGGSAQFFPGKLNDIVRSVPFVPVGAQAPGRRGGATGHGSAMAQVIVEVNPAADIHPIRVLNHRKVGKSYEVLTGLRYALYSGEFDCVSASFSSPVGSACDTSLGKSLDWMIAYYRSRTSTAIPIIAAAGNHSGKPSGYPAKLSGAVVVLAVDRFGNRASYNSQPPAQATTMEAYGGDPNDTLGDIVRPDGTLMPLYGTSLAAAAGAHLP